MTLIRMLYLKFAIKPHWPTKFNMKLEYHTARLQKELPHF